jgi:acyl-CoA reductase-like NAD-dependent aldehyde dehydrogenase
MELTKEYFDKELKTQLDGQTKELKSFAKEQTEELARIVSGGFDNVNEHLEEISAKLDVREQMKIFEKKFAKLEEALHIKL